MSPEGKADRAYWDDKYNQDPFCVDCGTELPDYWDEELCEECEEWSE